MLRFLPVLLLLGLEIYCAIDCIRTPDDEVRHLPKLLWLVLILIFPLVGSIAWLVAGRPQDTTGRAVPWPSTRTAGFPEYERPRDAPRGPDDDPDFLRSLDTRPPQHREPPDAEPTGS